MILADTAIWIDHFRRRNLEMEKLLVDGQIAMQPFILAELALGSLRDRSRTLAQLDLMPQARVADLREVRCMIEDRSLYTKGIGLTDAHLVASCLLTPGTRLWTRDAVLRGVARTLGIDAGLP